MEKCTHKLVIRAFGVVEEYFISDNAEMDDKIEEFLLSRGLEYSPENQRKLQVECDIPSY